MEAEYEQAHVAVGGLRLEYVVAIQGTVRNRPPTLANSRMATGAIEVTTLTRMSLVRDAGTCVYMPFGKYVTGTGDGLQVVAEEVVMLNAVRGALPFLITSEKEEATREDVRLR